MVAVRKFEELDVWQTSRRLTRRVYELSRGGRLCQDSGLRDQIRRASVSVMSQIAQGVECRSAPLLTECLSRAKGYAGEVRAQLYASLDAGYLRADEFSELMDLATATSQQISGLMDNVAHNPTGRPACAVPTLTTAPFLEIGASANAGIGHRSKP